MMKSALLFLSLVVSTTASYGGSKKVLFLGNSYTYVNNLPLMVADMAASAGDTLFFDSNSIGGATFYAHSINTVSLDKIKQGKWDYVVLQGQSLELFGFFTDDQFPFHEVKVLDSIIHQYNECGETMFYRTWGRKNGLSVYSYQTMDSAIGVNYMKHADTLNAVVSPVGDVWRNIRLNYPSIELYDPDESHPSLAGTYAAACCFYSAIFRKNPVACTYQSSLSSGDALNLKTAAKVVVYDSLMKWHIGEYDSLYSSCRNSPWSGSGTWNIYPNPSTSSLTMEFESGHVMQMYNSAGVLLKEFETAGLMRIDIEYLPSGPYLLREKNRSTGKIFIKQQIGDR